MRILFDVIFYKFFRFNKKIGNVNDDSFYAFKSVSFMIVLLSLNVFTIWFVYKAVIVRPKVFKAPPVVISLLLMTAIGWVLKRYYVRNDNYKKRLEWVEGYPKAIGRSGSILVIVYTIASFAIPFLVAVLFSPPAVHIGMHR